MGIIECSSPQWGIFSKPIPGRVGYQCSNFYRQLIKKGEIKDKFYSIVDGKISCAFGKGSRKRKVEGVEGAKRKTRKTRKSDEDDDEGEENDDSYYGSINKETMIYKDIMNPLPGFVDSITQEEVEKPAISPYGHVLGYRTWVRILTQEPKNICPFTKQPVTKRELIKLTHENIHEYSENIINTNEKFEKIIDKIE
jgi:hypothetical protein